jgi:hypothetical protein
MKNVFSQSGRRIAISGSFTALQKQTVSCEALWEALTDAEREALCSSTNAPVAAFLAGMLIARSIPLSCFEERLQSLADNGVLTSQRHAELVNALG